MIQRTGSTNIDVEFVRRHNGSTQQDVEYVRRYESGTWQDIWPEDVIFIEPGKLADASKIINVYRYYYSGRDEIRWHEWRQASVTSKGLMYSLPTTKSDQHKIYGNVITAERIDISKYNILIFECMMENPGDIKEDGYLMDQYGYDGAELIVIQDHININDIDNPPVESKGWNLTTNMDRVNQDTYNRLTYCNFYGTYRYHYSSGKIEDYQTDRYEHSDMDYNSTPWATIKPLHFEVDLLRAKQYVNGPCHIGIGGAVDYLRNGNTLTSYGKNYYVTKFMLAK